MFEILDKIEEFFRELLLGSIQANLESMFLDLNDKVGSVATDVGQTPMGWNSDVFQFIKSINDTVIIPIAGLIITAILCIELINMIMQKNNMQDTDTFEFFKFSGAKSHISVKVEMDEMDLTAAESKATYAEIRNWVQENYGFRVTNLNIAQVKRKHGIIERENHNKPKSEDSRHPGCPEEKEKAIEEALKHFQMIE